MSLDWEIKELAAEIVVVGGGVAGLAAAIAARELAPGLSVLVVEKAQADTSGCLAAGVNAINAYLHPGETPESFLEFVRAEASGVVRSDLVLTMAAGFNQAADKLEAWGVPFPRGGGGRYVRRGRHAVEVRGERIKSLMVRRARAVGVQILNRVAARDYLIQGGRVTGVYAVGVRRPIFYAIRARAVICTTGGATGLYRPPNSGAARGRRWYPPFNAGAGLAMGLRAGAELTSLEARFIPLRVKGTMAPTGTVALGVRAPQVNARGERYLQAGERTTAARLRATLAEEENGRGPCYLDTRQLETSAAARLRESYLSMCPAMVLWWAEKGVGPADVALEITGAEPTVVGGHGLAGYWVDTGRRTTRPGLYAAGDVAGGAPKKYVSGCMAEGEIAAASAVADITGRELDPVTLPPELSWLRIYLDYRRVYQVGVGGGISFPGAGSPPQWSAPTPRESLGPGPGTTGRSPGPDLGSRSGARPGGSPGVEGDSGEAEVQAALTTAIRPLRQAGGKGLAVLEFQEALQAVMEDYAGGASQGYRLSEGRLLVAREKLAALRHRAQDLSAADLHELMLAHQLQDLVLVASALVEHLRYRRETRWPAYHERIDYPHRDDERWLKFIASSYARHTDTFNLKEYPVR
ncbi:MAG: FAD-binding protein [Clostridia bacterium]|nr:MAG: FAD-binding protein [Clostridia bacterium]